MQQIIFIGLGHMGMPMAMNLMKAGYKVIGYDVQPNAVKTFMQAGGQGIMHMDAISEADICITMLQTGEQVHAVCLGEDGCFAKLRPGALFIDCSSIDVVSSRTITQKAYKTKIEAIDAPVSGGEAGALAGSLTFMVGGEEKAVERARPLLAAMGKHVIHAGPAGSGQIAKICNNMILGVSMIAVSEAFILAQKLGLSAEKLHEIVEQASGQCWVMDHYVPVPDVLPNVPANHDYEPGFSAAMMLKDLNLSQQAAGLAKVETPMGSLATKLYEKLSLAGFGNLDFSVIFKLLNEERDEQKL